MIQIKRSGAFLLIVFSCLVACSESHGPDVPLISELPNPTAMTARYPFITQTREGQAVLMSWFEVDEDQTQLVWAGFDGNGWSVPELIHESDQFFVNWADFPSITGHGDVPITAHWLHKVPGSTYAYHVNVAVRSASGDWSEPIRLHQDDSPTEHGFVSMVPIDEDGIFALWLDGHQTAIDLPMTLHSAIIQADGEVVQEQQADGSVCDCCQTSLARTGDSIVAVYRDRSNGEIRDIYRAIYDLNTASWGEPRPVANDGWKIAGCPVNGPQVVAHGEIILVAWFSAADNQPVSYLAASHDGGQNFSAPQVLNLGKTVGRVGLAMNNNGTALITWIESAGDEGFVKGRFWRGSELGDSFLIGDLESSRGSGFPRSAALGTGFLVAWTEPGQGSGPGIRIFSVDPAID